MLRLARTIRKALATLTACVVVAGTCCASASQRLDLPNRQGARNLGNPVLALNEQDLPAEDLTPTPAASPEASPSPGIPGAPAQNPIPSASEQSPIPQAASTDVIPSEPLAFPSLVAGAPGPTAASEPTPVPLAPDSGPLDVGSVQTSPQVGDAPLTPIIAASQADPALSASLRLTDEARAKLLGGHADDAIHILTRAISVNPANGWAYFFLGRAWLVKKDYDQAMTFFQRAQLGLAGNPEWLAETLAFEGLTYEQQGKKPQAVALYQQAMAASPGNLMARVGFTRLAPDVGLQQPAPQIEEAPSGDTPSSDKNTNGAPDTHSSPAPPAADTEQR